jgi:hypothetical protein
MMGLSREEQDIVAPVREFADREVRPMSQRNMIVSQLIDRSGL